MITSGIFFQNFKLKRKSLEIKKKLEKFIAENNSIAQSLKRNYQDFFKKKELKKYKSFKNIRVIGMGGSSLGTEALIDFVKEATGKEPIETYLGDINLFAVYESEETIKNINPNFELVSKLKGQGLIISSTSNDCDFVSRYFCPKYGINEDPVTGSAHTTLIPYWSKKLDKSILIANQVSKRGGELFCSSSDDRVLIGGNAVLYMKGTIEIN